MDGVRRDGRGRPVTVFAPGERVPVDETRRRATGLRGTRLFFEYEGIPQPWPDGVRPRRQADRDADEVLAVADAYDASRAVGFSRGARAIVGLLAEQPDRFERIALVLPPGGNAVGRYTALLRSPAHVPAEILVVGQRGDRGHPAAVAREWAERLGAHLEVFDSGDLYARPAYRELLAAFLGAR
jgi:3-oxoadipate enol-lactonase